jgi:hypothetical protein
VRGVKFAGASIPGFYFLEIGPEIARVEMGVAFGFRRPISIPGIQFRGWSGARTVRGSVVRV